MPYLTPFSSFTVKQNLLDISADVAEQFAKERRDLPAVFQDAVKIFAVHFFYPGIHGKRPGIVIGEQRDAVRHFRADAAQRRQLRAQGVAALFPRPAERARRDRFRGRKKIFRAVARAEIRKKTLVLFRQDRRFRKGKKALAQKDLLFARTLRDALQDALDAGNVVILRHEKGKSRFLFVLVEDA